MANVRKITHLNVYSVDVYATADGPRWGISGTCKFEEGATDHEHEEDAAEGSQNAEA